MSEQKKNWIIVVHSSEASGSPAMRLEDKTVIEVKEFIANQICNAAKDEDNIFDWADRSADEIESEERNNGYQLFGSALFKNYHLEITAFSDEYLGIGKTEERKLVDSLEVNGEAAVIEQFDTNDYSVYFTKSDYSVRGTLKEIFDEVNKHFEAVKELDASVDQQPKRQVLRDSKEAQMQGIKITLEDQPEFAGQIIDTFEDYLEDMMVAPDEFPNDEREDEDSALIYGSDYGELQDAIYSEMEKQGLFETENEPDNTKAGVLLNDEANLEMAERIVSKFEELLQDKNLVLAQGDDLKESKNGYISNEDEEKLIASVMKQFKNWGLVQEGTKDRSIENNKNETLKPGTGTESSKETISGIELSDIEWDAEPGIAAKLPDKVVITDSKIIEAFETNGKMDRNVLIEDYLSDRYEFLVRSYHMEKLSNDEPAKSRKKGLTYENQWGGVYENVELNVMTYTRDHLCMAITLTAEDGNPLGDVTAYIGHDIGNGSVMMANAAFIKDYGENAGMGDWLVKNGIAEPYMRFGKPVVGHSGMAEYPLYNFNINKLKEMDPEGWELHTSRWQKAYEEWAEQEEDMDLWRLEDEEETLDDLVDDTLDSKLAAAVSKTRSVDSNQLGGEEKGKASNKHERD